ncbi:MAG: hypothetical protein WA240_09695 [Nitrospirota bacterium]|jgi:hypothetical protein
MECPHLQGTKISACKGTDSPYIPSISELQEYCQTAHYIGCPFYEWIIKLKVKKSETHPLIPS